MFEVYLNQRRDLLVLERGTSLPLIGASGKWRKKKIILNVSDEISSAVQRQGYYLRKLSGARKGGSRPDKLALSFGHVQPLQHHHEPSRGDRGTKSKLIPGPHLVYSFLTTSPNAVVEPIHPKAMPVIVTNDE
jgi:hypothetical protein